MTNNEFLDKPMPFVPPILCRRGKFENLVRKGCTSMLLCGGPFPMTPRQVISQVEESGWSAELNDTTAKFTCSKCLAEEKGEEPRLIKEDDAE